MPATIGVDVRSAAQPASSPSAHDGSCSSTSPAHPRFPRHIAGSSGPTRTSPCAPCCGSPCAYQSARLCPERVDLALRRGVGVEIARHHEPVVVVEAADQVAIAVADRRAKTRRRRSPPAPRSSRGELLDGRARHFAVARASARPPRRSGRRSRCSRRRPARSISTLAPSSVPMVTAPLSTNFMLPVPEASMPAVEICSDRSAAGMIDLGQADVVVGQEHHLEQAAHRRDRC